MRYTYNTAFVKTVVFILSLSPLYEMIWFALTGRFGDFPSWEIIGITGEASLIFLLLTLAVTPARRILGWNNLIHIRRMLGLFAFFYAMIHFVIYIWREEHFSFHEFLLDIVRLPYITVGFIALILLIPLAFTARDSMMRKVGKNWKPIHRMVYAIAMLSIVHYVLVSIWSPLNALLYAFMLLLLLGYRFVYAKTPKDWML